MNLWESMLKASEKGEKLPYTLKEMEKKISNENMLKNFSKGNKKNKK